MADPKFHKKSDAISISKLASMIGGDLNGTSDMMIEDVAPLDQATSSQVSFLDNVKYKEGFKNTKAGACIVSEKMIEFAPDGCVLIISKSPYKSYALAAQYFYPAKYPQAQISQQAIIHETAKIEKGCIIDAGAIVQEGAKIGVGTWIEPNAVIGKNVEIGEGCRIGCNASISHAIMGDYSRLYPGVCVGQDGFGFAIDLTGHVKVPQLGRVIIGDHVEIGANTTIDRGSGPDTIIGDGTWIDNQVQIGHNAKIGRGCVLIAQVGIAGSTTLEDFVVVAAQTGIAGHLTIGKGTQIAAQSGVMRDLDAGSKVMGSPSIPVKQYMRQVATLKKLTNPKK